MQRYSPKCTTDSSTLVSGQPESPISKLNGCKHGHLCKILFDDSEDAIFICELKPEGFPGKIIDANDTACRRLGYSRDELLQMETFEIEDYSLVPEVDKLVEQFLRDKKLQFESRHLTKDGRSIPVKMEIKAIEFNGRAALIAIAHDLTEHRHTEINERRYQAIVEDQAGLICRFLPDGTITFVNEAYCDMYGLTQSELIGSTVYRLIPPDIRQKTREHLQALNHQRPVASIEEYWITPDGQIKWIEFTDKAIFNEHSEIVEIQSIGRDITQKKLLEQELRRHRDNLEELAARRTMELERTNRELQREITERKHAEEELQHFFQLSADILCILDFSGNFRRVNPAFYQLLGYSEGEFLALHPRELIHPDDVDSTLAAGAQLTQGIAVLSYENRVRCRDGSYKWLSWTAVPLPSKKLIYTVARDVTDRKQLEQDMARLDRLNLVGQIAASIGHEVRNPLTTVRGFLQMLQRKSPPSDNNYYGLMIEELDRANAIITEFLTLAKNKVVHRKTQNLNHIITSILPLLQAHAYEHNQAIRVNLQTIPELLLDEKEIRQLLLNLVRNSLEASEPNSEIIISTYLQDDEIYLTIQDQGCGIPPEVADKLGTPFLTTKENGTGLGLPVCFSIAARHNAAITFEQLPVGTIFFVRFNPAEPPA